MKKKFHLFSNKLLTFLVLTLLLPASAWALDVTVEWNGVDVSIPIGYRIYMREEGQSYDYNYPAWEGEETSHTFYGLSDGITHYFVIRAHDYNGNESASSAEITSSPELNAALAAGSGAATGGGGGGGGCFINSAGPGSSFSNLLQFIRNKFHIGKLLP